MMRIDFPQSSDIPGLRRLWQEAFGDDDTFLDGFFSAGFHPERCRCAVTDSIVAAALYWFDCGLDGRKFAYLYAVATGAAFRGRGLCRGLMENTHDLLRSRGYAGALLVPGDRGLFRMYEKMGYRRCCGIDEQVVFPGKTPETLCPANPGEYEARRRALLPPGGVIQDLAAIRVLAVSCRLYAGEDYVLADAGDRIPEYLGDPARLPGLLRGLGKEQMTVRLPGEKQPFAMCLPLTAEAPAPRYFGLALD